MFFGANLPKFLPSNSRQIQARTPNAASTLKMETGHYSEMYVNVYKVTRPRILECSNVHHQPGPE